MQNVANVVKFGVLFPGATGVAGLLRTDWRPGGGGSVRLVFLDGGGAHLRLAKEPKLLTAAGYLGWIEKRKEVLGGPFAGPLRELLVSRGAAAPDSPLAPAMSAPKTPPELRAAAGRPSPRWNGKPRAHAWPVAFGSVVGVVCGTTTSADGPPNPESFVYVS